MGIYELAKLLGEAIKEDAKYKKLQEAQAVYEADEELQVMIQNYNQLQEDMQKIAGSPEHDMLQLDTLQQKADQLYKDITARPSYAATRQAEDDVNALMTTVNSVITYTITGELPSNCTHDCSTCGGCH